MVDLGEFGTALARIGGKLAQMSVAEAESAFDEIDTSGRGKIKFDEFCRWVATQGIGGTLTLA